MQWHYRKWRLEFTTQHLSTVKYLRQQLSLWTVCRPARRMFLYNYRKMYATTSVSFWYLSSVVDKYTGEIYHGHWSVCIENLFKECYWSLVTFRYQDLFSETMNWQASFSFYTTTDIKILLSLKSVLSLFLTLFQLLFKIGKSCKKFLWAVHPYKEARYFLTCHLT